MMSDEDRDRLAKHLDRTGFKACPVCGGEEIGIGGEYGIIRYGRDPGERRSGALDMSKVLPLFSVICTKCFHVMLFAVPPIIEGGVEPAMREEDPK